MTNYRGKFTIIAADGTEVELSGTLSKTAGPGLGSWGGSATADVSAVSAIPQEMARLRLPDGSEADALITNVHTNAGQSGAYVTVAIQGSGPPPF